MWVWRESWPADLGMINREEGGNSHYELIALQIEGTKLTAVIHASQI